MIHDDIMKDSMLHNHSLKKLPGKEEELYPT